METNMGGRFRAAVFPALILGCLSCKLFGGGGGDDGGLRTTLPMIASRMVVTEAEYEKYRYGDLFEPTKIQAGQRKAVYDGKVVALDLQGVGIDEMVSLIGQHPGETLAIRADLPDLCEGKVRDAIKDAGIKYLSVTIWGYNVESVACLDKLKVDELYLSWAEAADSVIQPLRKVDALRELNLSKTKITDLSFEFIAQMEDLRTLRVDGTEITDKAIGHIAGLKKLENLRRLDLSLTPITDESLALLSDLQGLRDLDLGGTAASRKGFEHLAIMKSLRYLNLNQAVVTDDCVEPLAKLKQLKFLGIRNVHMSMPARAELEDALPGVKIESGGTAFF